MHKMDLFTAMFDYIEYLFSMKLGEKEKQSIQDSFEVIDCKDGIQRSIRAIELGLGIKLPQELFEEERVFSSHISLEALLKRLNFEASKWTSEHTIHICKVEASA